MSTTREVHVGVDRSDTMPDTWRLYVECSDEMTQMIVTGRHLFVMPATDEALRSSDLGEMLLLEHQERCSACRAWAQGRPDPLPPQPFHHAAAPLPLWDEDPKDGAA